MIRAIAALLLLLAIPAAAYESPAKLGAKDAKAIARDAYVFGLPLVYNTLQQDVLSNVPKPEGMRAPRNQFAHYRDLPDPSNRTVVALNVDTLYSIGIFDLTAEPLILSVPPMGKRWWLMQVLDAWNDVSAAPGTRTLGNEGGDFALCGPSFKGSLPPGVKEIRVDTHRGGLGGRTYTAGPSDYAAVHAIQDQYRLTPLSKWRVTPAWTPPASVPVEPGVDAKTPIGDQVFAMSPEAFFQRVNELLAGNPAREADKPMMSRIARLGIAPGAKFTTKSLGADVRKAIDAGVAEAKKQILAQQTKMGKEVNGWVMALDVGRYGTNYLNRAAWTYFAVGANLPEDAVYPNTTKDADGNPLDAKNHYTLRFAVHQIPPVKDFWSLTLYDQDGYLVDNPIERHSLGDRSNLVTGPDGSVTIYVQSGSPGPAFEANWLPAPKSGPFKLYLRLYGPKPEVIEGKWLPPPVAKPSEG